MGAMLNVVSGNSQIHLAGLPAKVLYMGEDFKTRMRRIRERAGFRSQAAAADAIGCPRGTVGMWEAPSSGVKTVGSDLLFRVARAYRVRPDWINDLGSDEDEFPWTGQATPKKISGSSSTHASPDLEEIDGDSSTSLPTGLSTARPSAEIAPGYVRVGLLDAAADMGHGAENVDFPEVIREMDLAEVQLRNLIGFLPRPGRLKMMTGRGISMEPVIKSGDVVIIDTGCQHFDGDGIYVINSGSGVQIKALQDRGDGIYVVSANPTFPPYKASANLIIGGKVYVRNRLERLD